MLRGARAEEDEERLQEIGRDCKQPVLDGGFRPVGLCGVVWEVVKLRWRGRLMWGVGERNVVASGEDAVAGGR